ncbi:hypothetical protein ACFQX6_22880 [Streptosporangium lutulentum]
MRGADLLRGWRFILHDRVLRRLFFNGILVSGLIMATVPLLAVLLLGEYHFSALEYGLAFGVPALGGFVGARLSARLVKRYGGTGSWPSPAGCDRSSRSVSRSFTPASPDSSP